MESPTVLGSNRETAAFMISESPIAAASVLVSWLFSMTESPFVSDSTRVIKELMEAVSPMVRGSDRVNNAFNISASPIVNASILVSRLFNAAKSPIVNGSDRVNNILIDSASLMLLPSLMPTFQPNCSEFESPIVRGSLLVREVFAALLSPIVRGSDRVIESFTVLLSPMVLGSDRTIESLSLFVSANILPSVIVTLNTVVGFSPRPTTAQANVELASVPVVRSACVPVLSLISSNSALIAFTDDEPANALVESRWVSPLAGTMVIEPVAFALFAIPIQLINILPAVPAAGVTVVVTGEAPVLFAVSTVSYVFAAPVYDTAFHACLVDAAKPTDTVSFAAAARQINHTSVELFVPDDTFEPVTSVADTPPTVTAFGEVVPIYAIFIIMATNAAWFKLPVDDVAEAALPTAAS